VSRINKEKLQAKMPDGMYHALAQGKEMPELLTFLRERLSAVQAVIKSGKDTATISLSPRGRILPRLISREGLDALQITAGGLQLFGWHKSTLTQIAAELQEVIKEQTSKDLAPKKQTQAASNSAAGPKRPGTKAEQLAQVREQIRREPNALKRGLLAREAKRLREG
jgi:hypothetical protein